MVEESASSDRVCVTDASVREAAAGVESACADAGCGAVASEEDDCVIVCARDADERSDSGVSGLRSGGSASSVEEREWRGSMAHGYGGGPPPPLLHLPPPAPLYAGDLLWKQRAYPPPLHAPLHHALTEDYLAAANYDRERHERLLRLVQYVLIYLLFTILAFDGSEHVITHSLSLNNYYSVSQFFKQ